MADLKVSRTWMWGPQADSAPLLEPYVESPGGQREVQYFDKSRMEITHPDGDQSSLWYVTNGLLAKELITGNLQLGDTTFHQYAPAQVNVAGDGNDPNGPTYASFTSLMGYGPIPNGWKVTQTVNRAGQVSDNPALASYNVSAQDVGAATHHNVASVFWAFMTSSGPIYHNGQNTTGPLLPSPFYATGYPLTEAYWTNVLVGGVAKQVLVQVYERRVLTYTPSNPDGWQVEAGNVGQHYYTWRYVDLGNPASPAPAPSPTPTPAPSPPPSPSPTPPSQTYPGWILGLTASDALSYTRNAGGPGWWCADPVAGNLTDGSGTYLDFGCYSSSDAEPYPTYFVGINTDHQGHVFGILAWVADSTNPSRPGWIPIDQLASDILGYLAAMPYGDAQPASAAQLVRAHIGERGGFQVGSASFGVNDPSLVSDDVMWRFRELDIYATGRFN